MGHVRKRDGKYQARWIDPDTGEERAQTFRRKVDADKHVIVKESTKLAGTYVDGTSKITVAEYARQYAATRPHRELTAVRTATLIKTHIDATPLGSRRLVAVRPSEVQAWATDRNPVEGVSLPRAEHVRVEPLTVEQVRALAAAMPDRCKAMVVAQGGLGSRIGELMALRVQDIDFLRRTVRVQDQLSLDGKRRVPTKTPRSRRTMPLPTVVAEALAAHIAEFPPIDGLIFTTLHGLPWRREYYGQRTFKRAVRESGIPDKTTTHDLRHHYASLLLDAGESVVAVAERLGDTPAMVLKVYGHLMPDSEDRTRRAIDDAWLSDGRGTDGGDHVSESGLVSG